METELVVVMNFNISDPDRGMLTVPAYPLRKAPRLTTDRLQAEVHYKDFCRKGPTAPTIGANRLIEARLLKGPATIEELHQSIGCHKNTVMKLLAQLRRAGRLRSSLLPAKGRGAREQSHWIEA